LAAYADMALKTSGIWQSKLIAATFIPIPCNAFDKLIVWHTGSIKWRPADRPMEKFCTPADKANAQLFIVPNDGADEVNGADLILDVELLVVVLFDEDPS